MPYGDIGDIEVIDGELDIRTDHDMVTLMGMLLDEGSRWRRDYCFELHVRMRESDIDMTVKMATEVAKTAGHVRFWMKGKVFVAKPDSLFDLTEWFYFVLVGPG